MAAVLRLVPGLIALTSSVPTELFPSPVGRLKDRPEGPTVVNGALPVAEKVGTSALPTLAITVTFKVPALLVTVIVPVYEPGANPPGLTCTPISAVPPLAMLPVAPEEMLRAPAGNVPALMEVV